MKKKGISITTGQYGLLSSTEGNDNTRPQDNSTEAVSFPLPHQHNQEGQINEPGSTSDTQSRSSSQQLENKTLLTNLVPGHGYSRVASKSLDLSLFLFDPSEEQVPATQNLLTHLITQHSSEHTLESCLNSLQCMDLSRSHPQFRHIVAAFITALRNALVRSNVRLLQRIKLSVLVKYVTITVKKSTQPGLVELVFKPNTHLGKNTYVNTVVAMIIALVRENTISNNNDLVKLVMNMTDQDFQDFLATEKKALEHFGMTRLNGGAIPKDLLPLLGSFNKSPIVEIHKAPQLDQVQNLLLALILVRPPLVDAMIRNGTTTLEQAVEHSKDVLAKKKKKIPCKNNAEGVCPKGDKCEFSHEQQTPDEHSESKIVITKSYAHSDSKTSQCRYFTSSGNCKYGARCRFLHLSSHTTPFHTTPSHTTSFQPSQNVYAVDNGTLLRPFESRSQVNPNSFAFSSSNHRNALTRMGSPQNQQAHPVLYGNSAAQHQGPTGFLNQQGHPVLYGNGAAQHQGPTVFLNQQGRHLHGPFSAIQNAQSPQLTTSSGPNVQYPFLFPNNQQLTADEQQFPSLPDSSSSSSSTD
jgi:hypothetical protein